MNFKVKQFIRTHVPNNPFFQRLLARARLRQLSLYDQIEEKVRKSKDRENMAFRSKIVKECFDKWPEKAAQIKKEAQEILPLSADYKGRELDPQLLDDVVFTFFGLGFTPDEYMYFRLEKKTVKERMGYLSNKQKGKFHSHFDNLIESSVFTDKYLTYLRFQKDFKRELVEIDGPGNYLEFEDFVGRHPKYVKKDVYESCARSVELVDSANCGKTLRQQFEEMAAGSKFVVEELIVQSDEMASFNPTSVNTVRCISMYTKNGVCVPFAYFRTGSSGSFVDNCGIRSELDTKTGMSITDGFDEKANRFPAHPDTGAVYKGFQIPEWDQLLEVVTRVASQVPGVRIIGWDFAHTDKGWVIVEGNAMSQIELVQIPFERGMRKEFEDLFRQMDPIIEYNFE